MSESKIRGGMSGQKLLDLAIESGNPVAIVMARAADRLFYGEDFGLEYHSPFGAVLLLGAYEETNGARVRPAVAAMFNQNVKLDWPRPALIRKLKEVLTDLEQIEATSKQTPE